MVCVALFAPIFDFTLVAQTAGGFWVGLGVFVCVYHGAIRAHDAFAPNLWDLFMKPTHQLKGTQSLSLRQFKKALASDCHWLIDVRPAKVFAQKHISGAMNLPLEQEATDFALSLSQLFYLRKSALLIAPVEDLAKTLQRLQPQCQWVGYLEGGLATWEQAGEPLEAFQFLSPAEVESLLQSGQASPLPPFAQS